MRKLIIIALVLTGCGYKVSKEDMDVAEYICATTGEELYEMSVGYFKCGGIEGTWESLEDAVQREGATCILENTQ